MEAVRRSVPDAQKVLIVEDDTLVGMGLKSDLESLGHTVLGQAADFSEGMELFRKLQPDLVLLDIRLSGGDGIELANELMAIRPCPMIIVSAFGDEELHRRAAAAGVFGYLIKPATKESLSAQIRVAVSRFDELETYRAKNDDLLKSLEDRKLVERAKGILMKRLQLDEPNAHRRLQQESQKRRISLADVSKKVIESEKLLGG